MRHLDKKDFGNAPLQLLTKICIEHIEDAIINKDGKKYKNYNYRHIEVLNKLRAISLNKITINDNEIAKCFYCETKVEQGVTLQVEHFRPKDEVDKIDNNNNKHDGYYWLGYEWTNLLLSCPLCNQQGAKGNRFPVAWTRANEINPIKINSANEKYINRTYLLADKYPLIDEIPLLLNPEIDIPENFLTFDFNDLAKLNQIPEQYNKGFITIEILKLNRPKLKKDRQNILNKFINYLNLFQNKYLNSIHPIALLDEYYKNLIEEICKDIKKSQNIEEEYSLFGKFINDNFETFFAQFFKEPFRTKLIEIYNSL